MALPRLLALSACAVLVSGCAASVTRVGYEPAPARLAEAPDTAQDAGRTCPVLITADSSAIAAGPAELLGQIRYRDSGFSTRCDEASALRVFQADACALGADVVLITSERSPNWLSTCYRAEAALYAVSDPAALAEVRDRRDPDRLVVNRGAESGQQALWMVGYAAGMAGSLLLVDLLFGGE